MADETPIQVFYIENTQPYNVIDITEVTIPFYVEITDQAHDGDLIEIEDLPVPVVACYIENSKVFNITMDSSGKDGKDGLPGKDGIGLPGKDGTSITFESLTPEQLALLQQPATDAAADLYETITQLQQQINNNVFNNWFFLDQDGNVGTNYNLYSTKGVSAYGVGVNNSGGTGGGLIQNVYGYDDLGGTYDNTILTNTFNAYTINQLHTRLSQVEVGAADYIPLSQKGTANGVAELDANGLIISAQLPSYVDDVIEVSTYANLPVSGESGKIYVTTDTNITYRWTGTTYVEISKSISLGETSSTAYRGDRGKTAYDHSQLTGNPHSTTFAQIVSRPTTIEGYDITDAYTKTEVNSALTSKLDKSVFDDLFEKVEVSTGVFAIKAKYNFYGVGEVSAYGLGSTGGGGGSTVAWGTESAGAVPLTVEGITKTLSLASHTHSGYLTEESDPTVPGHVKAITTSDITNWNAYGSQVHSHTNISVLNATTASFLTADRNKLDGIAAGANNYTHPATHAPSIIAQDTNNRFVTDANISTWNAKANGTHTHSISDISTLQDALNSKLPTDIFTAHAANQTTNVKHLTDAQLTYLNNLISWWKVDANGNLYTEKNLYSKLEVSAYGLGAGGSGGGGIIETVYGYSNLGQTFNNTTLTDTFNAYTINQINNRLLSVEGGSATGINVTGTGDVLVNATKSGNTITLTKGNQSWANLTGKPSTFTPSAHTHSAADITSGVFATDRLGTGTPSSSNYLRGDGTWASVTSANNGTLTLSTGTGLTGSATFTANQSTNSTFTVSPVFGTTAGTIAQGNDSRINNGQTAYGWGNHASAGYALSSALSNYAPINNPTFTGLVTAPTFVGSLSGNATTATKLQTARTIAGVSFDGTTNIDIPFANLSSKPTTLSEYGITGLTTNYLTKWNGSTIVNSQIFDNGTNVGIGKTPSYKLDVEGVINVTNGWIGIGGSSVIASDGVSNYLGHSSKPMYVQGSALFYAHPSLGTGNIWNFTNANRTDVNWAVATLTAQTDILTPFNTWSYNGWSYPTDKNSLNKFLKLFDIDTAGNLVVKTNLYSTGEVSAYKSGTGVSGLTLMADMNANGKNITGASSVVAGDAVIGNDPLGFLDGDSPGLYNAGNDGIIAAYNNTTGKFHYANGNLTVDYLGLTTTTTMKANEFKFGLWSFKEVSGNMVISYNGTAKATIQSSRINSNL